MSWQREGHIHVLNLCGELDSATAGLLREELTRIEAGGARVIIIDLSGLTFIDSTGIKLLVLADARSRARRRSLTLRSGSAAVQRAFALGGVEERLRFADRSSRRGKDAPA